MSFYAQQRGFAYQITRVILLGHLKCGNLIGKAIILKFVAVWFNFFFFFDNTLDAIPYSRSDLIL